MFGTRRLLRFLRSGKFGALRQFFQCVLAQRILPNSPKPFWLLSASDSKYFPALVSLIGSIQGRAGVGERVRIVVANLGMKSFELDFLRDHFKVLVVRPSGDTQAGDGLNSYRWKLAFLSELKKLVPLVQPEDTVLYLDATTVLNPGLECVEKRIKKRGHLLVDHSYTETYRSPPAKKRIRNICHFPDNFIDLPIVWDETALAAPMARGSVIGFRVDSSFHQKVIREAFRLVCRFPRLLRGDKFGRLALKNREPQVRAWLDSIQDDEIRSKDFTGARHDQFVISYLAAAHSMVIDSEKKFVADISPPLSSLHNQKLKEILSELRAENVPTSPALVSTRQALVSDMLPIPKTVKLLTRNRHEIESRLTGKSVALCGPAPYNSPDERSEALFEANRRDMVGQVNKFRLEALASLGRGVRVDFMVHALSQSEAVGGPFSSVEFTSDDPFYFSPFPWFAPGSFEGTFNSQRGNRSVVESFLKNQDFPLWTPGQIDYLFLERLLGYTRPNTGFSGIFFLLSTGIQEIYLTGFSFFRGGYDRSYRTLTEKQARTEIRRKRLHEPKKQEELFREMLLEDSRIVLGQDVKRSLRVP